MAKPSRTQRPDVSHLSRRTVLQRGVTAGASLAMGSLPAVPRRSLHAAQATPIPGTNLRDGEWIAYLSNEGGLPQLWLLETWGGARKKIAISRRIWKRPMGTLRVSVTDAATGGMLPARIHGLATDGKFYPPADVYSRLGRSAKGAAGALRADPGRPSGGPV